MWFSVFLFWCQFLSSYMYLDDIKLGLVAEWPPFGKELLIQLLVSSLCIKFIYYPFWYPTRDFDSDCTSS